MKNLFPFSSSVCLHLHLHCLQRVPGSLRCVLPAQMQCSKTHPFFSVVSPNGSFGPSKGARIFLNQSCGQGADIPTQASEQSITPQDRRLRSSHGVSYRRGNVECCQREEKGTLAIQTAGPTEVVTPWKLQYNHQRASVSPYISHIRGCFQNLCLFLFKASDSVRCICTGPEPSIEMLLSTDLLSCYLQVCVRGALGLNQ